MFSPWNVSLLVALFCCNVLSQEIALDHDLAGRQIGFSTIGLCKEGSCPTASITTSSTTSSTTSKSSSKTSSSSFLTTSPAISPSPSPSSAISILPSTTSTTPSGIYNPYALTTTFTQPPACTDGFTSIEDWGTDLYDNLIFSSPGYNLSYTSCFPPQFYSSVLASIASTIFPPFAPLICPSTWENYAINSTYVICCPNGYLVLAPNISDPIRPAAGAVCYSLLGPSELLDVTVFDLTGGQTFVPMTAGANATNIVFANAFDGFTTGVTNAYTPPSGSQGIASNTGSYLSTTAAFSTSSSSLKPAATSSSAATSISVRIIYFDFFFMHWEPHWRRSCIANPISDCL